MRHFILTSLVLILAGLCAFAQAGKKPETSPDVDLLWGVKLLLRDGTHLNATVYKPHDQKSPLPVIFELTPYISDTYHARGYYFAQHGYVFVIVDVRGRGNSEGKFDPFFQEPADGYDTTEWLAKQPYCNGKVAMWGGSYAGFDQWLTMRQMPPHLATIVPAASAHAGVDFPMFHGVFGSYVIQWLTFTSGITPNINLFGEDNFWASKFKQMYVEHRAFRDLDKIVGNDTTVFQKWIAHPSFDEYWQQLAIQPAQYHAFNLPILTITGSYDADQPGAMTYYRGHMKYGTEAAKAQHYLIVGPWDHAGTRTPNKEVGGLTFGEASMVDLNNLHVQWYDWAMKSGPKPNFLKKRVAYYVMGVDEWKYADSLEAIANVQRTLHLDSNGEANDVAHSGSLMDVAPGDGSKPDHYVYDPLNNAPGLDADESKGYLTSQHDAMALRGDGVIYHSAPFTEATEITGWVKLSVWAAMDVADTDFGADLFEILPDGSSVRLSSDLMRARYREGSDHEKLVKPGEIARYDFDGFTFFSRKIAKGSRLRLILSTPNNPGLEKNYNSGGVVANETAIDAHTAHITIYHDAQHSSVLELPEVK